MRLGQGLTRSELNAHLTFDRVEADIYWGDAPRFAGGEPPSHVDATLTSVVRERTMWLGVVPGPARLLGISTTSFDFGSKTVVGVKAKVAPARHAAGLELDWLGTVLSFGLTSDFAGWWE